MHCRYTCAKIDNTTLKTPIISKKLQFVPINTQLLISRKAYADKVPKLLTNGHQIFKIPEKYGLSRNYIKTHKMSGEYGTGPVSASKNITQANINGYQVFFNFTIDTGQHSKKG